MLAAEEGLRDRILLQLLYGAGLRVSEADAGAIVRTEAAWFVSPQTP